jgi:hypothetical protein
MDESMTKTIITIMKKVLLSPLKSNGKIASLLPCEECNGFYWQMNTTRKIDVMSVAEHGARKTSCSIAHEEIRMVERLCLCVKKQPSSQTFCG